ncbi:ceramide-1-phosphate transfer protein-like [Clytia hemisphaerica]|uniref:Glycolipid transfer protein domain-containing protein n=1 Tax=Clytia hemisphaerica TaxID=252671 RepID=A0A7M5X3K5_9CNID
MSLFSFSKFFLKKRAWLLVTLVCLVFYQIISTERNAIIITEINISKDTLPRKDLKKSPFNIHADILALRKDKEAQQILTGNVEEVTTIGKEKAVKHPQGFNEMTFDIDLVTKSFEECHENQLNLVAYVTGYSEIYNFFNVLGTVFGFIASDVKEKLDILKDLESKGDENAIHYKQVDNMMAFEMERNKKTKEELFGSRTLLRLHRALDFTKQFLEQLALMKDDDKVATMAGKVYTATLGNFHPWLIRKAAGVALYSLPNRRDLIKKIAPGGIDDSVLKEKIEACVQKIDIVYKDIHDLYTKNDLHGLP